MEGRGEGRGGEGRGGEGRGGEGRGGRGGEGRGGEGRGGRGGEGGGRRGGEGGRRGVGKSKPFATSSKIILQTATLLSYDITCKCPHTTNLTKGEGQSFLCKGVGLLLSP